MKFNILIVDDEKNIREGLGKSLEMDGGYNVFLAANGNEASDIIHKKEIDLVITDLKMPGMSGEELLRKVSGAYPTVPVIILTGHGTIETAVEAMRDGAYDFLTKPVNLDRLSLLVKRALSNKQLVLQHRQLQEELERLSGKQQYTKIIGRSSQMKKILDLVEQVASTKASVLITGESGVGKELVADALHNLSNRKKQPFIKVHCAALSPTLLESELFGHEKGSFTGAIARKRGRFELAHTGTLFLDEIGEIDQTLQVKILRVLQEKTFERVGGEESIEVDVRLVSATNRDLKKEIDAGRFREDLFYRLNVVNIHVPPLRERKDDIMLLASSFLEEFCTENQKDIKGIDQKAKLSLYNYSWPGNVRELRNCIESAVVMCKSNVISNDDLPAQVVENTDSNIIRISAGLTLEEAEKSIIQFTLNQVKGNKTRAADILGIGRKTLHRKLNEYGIDSE